MNARSATFGPRAAHSIPSSTRAVPRAPPAHAHHARDPVRKGHAGVRRRMRASRHEPSVPRSTMTASRAGQGVPRLLEPSPRRTSTALRDASHTAPASGAGARGRRSNARSVARSTPDLAPAARTATPGEPPVSRRVRDVLVAALPSTLHPRSARRNSPGASLDTRMPRVPHMPVNRCNALLPSRSQRRRRLRRAPPPSQSSPPNPRGRTPAIRRCSLAGGMSGLASRGGRPRELPGVRRLHRAVLTRSAAAIARRLVSPRQHITRKGLLRKRYLLRMTLPHVRQILVVIRRADDSPDHLCDTRQTDAQRRVSDPRHLAPPSSPHHPVAPGLSQTAGRCASIRPSTTTAGRIRDLPPDTTRASNLSCRAR